MYLGLYKTTQYIFYISTKVHSGILKSSMKPRNIFIENRLYLRFILTMTDSEL